MVGWAFEDMVRGYSDGFDPDAPWPSENRSLSYRHGFANAWVDRRLIDHWPRTTADKLRKRADEVIETDEMIY